MKKEQLNVMMRTLQVTVPANNARAASSMMAKVATEERARVISRQTARGGIAPTTAQVVDGRRGADFASVRPEGYILIEYGYVREIALVIMGTLIGQGPKQSGAWGESIVVMVDGVQSSPRAIPHDAHDVLVAPTVVQSRRLEVGYTKKGDPFVLEDDDYRLVERVALHYRDEYKRVARISHTYVQLGGGKDRSMRYPAISILGWQVR